MYNRSLASKLYISYAQEGLNVFFILKSMNSKFNDVFICETALPGKNGQSRKLAVFSGGFNKSNPSDYMDSVVREYVGNSPHNVFVESHLDIPWVRVVIEDINGLDFVEYDKQQIGK